MVTSTLIDSVDTTFVIDAEALYSLFPKHADHLNERVETMIAQVLRGATCPLRFSPCFQLYGSDAFSNLRRIATSLVPFPRMHLFTLAHYPLGPLDGTLCVVLYGCAQQTSLMCS
jgi:tubulin beta